jgi:hypothetical protein
MSQIQSSLRGFVPTSLPTRSTCASNVIQRNEEVGSRRNPTTLIPPTIAASGAWTLRSRTEPGRPCTSSSSSFTLEDECGGNAHRDPLRDGALRPPVAPRASPRTSSSSKLPAKRSSLDGQWGRSLMQRQPPPAVPAVKPATSGPAASGAGCPSCAFLHRHGGDGWRRGGRGPHGGRRSKLGALE